MNREETKKAIEVMQAYVDGDDVEQQNGVGIYPADQAPPHWAWGDNIAMYRIKPKPREWWLNTTSSECYVTKECAEKFSGGREVVWVREVV